MKTKTPCAPHAQRAVIRPHAQQGVMLLEVLVAVLVFSAGLLGLVALQARALQFSMSAEDTNRAALLANEIGAVMWSNLSASVPDATYAAWQARVANAAVDGLPNGVGTITTAANTATVTVSWRPPSAASGAAGSRFVTQVLIP